MTRDKGFALLEVCVAILLLGIVIAATAFSLTAARMYATSAKHHYLAASLARYEIENIVATRDGSPSSYNILTSLQPH